jgi:hypothetical protein
MEAGRALPEFESTWLDRWQRRRIGWIEDAVAALLLGQQARW